MARLGEILVQQELISEEQLHEALAAQVVYGGRLGTNLVEMAFLSLDALGKALARRHRTPAALASHFDRCDAVIQQRVPADVAGKWRMVPIGRLAHDSQRIAIAVRDPLPDHARAEIASYLEIDARDLVQAVAPELRIHYHLELAYQIPRANRFLRIKSRVPTDLPVPPAAVDDTDVDGWRFQQDASGGGTLVKVGTEDHAGESRPVEPRPKAPPPPPPGRTKPPAPPPRSQTPTPGSSPSLGPAAARATARPEPASASGPSSAAAEVCADDLIEVGAGSDPALRLDTQAQPLVPPPPRPAERERRSFVPSLGEAGSTTSTLARIAVRQVATESAIRMVREPTPRAASLEELARMVRRSETRDKVGELIITALAELPGAPLDAAAILVARPPLAIGWKGFCEEGSPAIESLAVPLDQPGLIAGTYNDARPRVLEIDPLTVSVVDERMWSLLGARRPNRVAIAPITVVDKVLCLLYAQTRAALGQSEAAVITLAEAASTAFARLLRAAQR